eukprot:TRINITY_DN4834_c0_g1_i1.p1 TRINITY_DN4834_c0_g1~~TRINITY_DN4834_c0_g1_i1.p1  ORF type:complete len:357 (+),score=127.78 TRINITY_DN4834_c0_g1_i1:66-1136(+)
MAPLEDQHVSEEEDVGSESDDGGSETNRLEQLHDESEELTLENSILKDYYERNAADGVGDEEDKRLRNRQRRRQAAPTTLTLEQKAEVAEAEHAVAVQTLEEAKRGSERLIDTLHAVLEETDIRIAELKKDAYEFKRDVVVGAENMRTGKTVAEKVVRYMEDKLRQRDTTTEKLRLKNAALKGQIQKVEAQLRQKDDMGDALHYIDFHQLQIENKQHVARIEERNAELLRLKSATGRAVQALSSLKGALQQAQADSDWLAAEIAARTAALAKTTTDLATVQEEATAERRVVRRLSQVPGDNSEAPHIDTYIAQKKALYELQQELRSWERKVEIAEMASKRARQESKRSKEVSAVPF